VNLPQPLLRAVALFALSRGTQAAVWQPSRLSV